MIDFLIHIKYLSSLLRSKYLLLVCLMASLSIRAASAQPSSTAGVAAHSKLVVFLIADQFPSNYLSFCLNKSQANGFRHLLENGANFTDCHYSAATNQTATNLAVIASGAYPWLTGVTGNQWYDRHKQKTVKAIAGESSLPGAGSNTNTDMMAGTTVGDELKIATGGLSHIITIAGNNQEALLLAGKLGDRAFWWDGHTSNFVSLMHSGKELPAWAQTFNEQHHGNQYSGKIWQPLAESSKSFAHTLEDSQFIASPWINEMIFDFARQAINEDSLGQQDTSDMLGINFSSFEAVAKNYGSYSPESLDLALRFDQSLADFSQFLDKKLGQNNYLLVFTACHGAGASPDFLQAQGMEAGAIEAKTFREQLNSALSSRLGNANWIEAFEPPNVYFNLNTIDHSNYRQPDIEKLASKLGRSLTGAGEIYGAFQLFMNELPSGPWTKAVRKSYFWGRSGELYLIPKPGFTFLSESDGTACGSPYNYDTQVPLIFSGNAVKFGTYATPADMDDLAPTVANILGICSPALAEGHVLSEAVRMHERTKLK